MFSSLRSRLWLSYAVLILVALVMVAVGLVMALQRNPLLYRSTVLNIRGGKFGHYPAPGRAVLSQRSPGSERGSSDVLQNQTDIRQLRMAMLQPPAQSWWMVGSAHQSFARAALPLVTTDPDPNLALLIRDSKGIEWFYTLHKIGGSEII